MSNLETAKKLLEWNAANLNAEAKWTAEDLATYFAQNFIVLANGRCYEANYQNYADFLNKMRATLKSIQYKCHDFISNQECVVIPLMATLTHITQLHEQYEAILILKFDTMGKIILWQEVYTKIEPEK